MTKALSHTRMAAPKGVSLISRIMNGFALFRQRRALTGLSDTALDDIGVSRTEARNESKRPAWDAPAHWHR